MWGYRHLWILCFGVFAPILLESDNLLVIYSFLLICYLRLYFIYLFIYYHQITSFCQVTII